MTLVELVRVPAVSFQRMAHCAALCQELIMLTVEILIVGHGMCARVRVQYM